MFTVFGLQFGQDKRSASDLRSIVPRSDQGAIVVDDTATGYTGQGAEFFIYGQSADHSFRSQKDRIELYRRMLENPYVDQAVDDIVGEAITFDVEKGMVSPSLDKTDFSASVKSKIIDEFNFVLQLMEFDFTGSDIFKQWYVDGQTYIHVVVDPDNIKNGIQEIRFVDPRAVQKIVEIQSDPKTGEEISRKEYFLYMPAMAINRNNITTKNNKYDYKAVKLTADSVVYSWSGRTNIEGLPISYMDFAIKSWNQINSLEDAFVVYHLSRAPSKRAFYVDVGDLPKREAERYMKTLIEKYKNKAIYDFKTGTVDNAAQIQSMFHDYWLPRQNGKASTEIGVIEGTGLNFGGTEDLKYWLEKLWRSFKIPVTRLNSESITPFGRGSEITRDELKFQKFIDRLRSRFSRIFSELLKRQLLLKNIITLDDWNRNSYNIRFDYARDSMFFEMKNTEILEMRLQTLNTIAPYIDVYFSEDYVMKNILMMTDEQIEEMKEIRAAKQEEERKALAAQGGEEGAGGNKLGTDKLPTSAEENPNKNSQYFTPKNKANPQKSLLSTRDKNL